MCGKTDSKIYGAIECETLVFYNQSGALQTMAVLPTQGGAQGVARVELGMFNQLPAELRNNYNNATFLSQYNAAGSAYIEIVRVNASNEVEIAHGGGATTLGGNLKLPANGTMTCAGSGASFEDVSGDCVLRTNTTGKKVSFYDTTHGIADFTWGGGNTAWTLPASAASLNIVGAGSGQYTRIAQTNAASPGILLDAAKILFDTEGGTRKGMWDNTGLRIGDATAPGCKLAVGVDTDTTNVNVRVNGKTATSATAGTAGAPPGQVVGYLSVNINGTERKMPPASGGYCQYGSASGKCPALITCAQSEYRLMSDWTAMPLG